MIPLLPKKNLKRRQGRLVPMRQRSGSAARRRRARHWLWSGDRWRWVAERSYSRSFLRRDQ